jgi:hypothetical protein
MAVCSTCGKTKVEMKVGKLDVLGCPDPECRAKRTAKRGKKRAGAHLPVNKNDPPPEPGKSQGGGKPAGHFLDDWV